MNFRKNESVFGSHGGDGVAHAADYLRSHSVDEMAGDVRDKADALAGDVRDKADALVGDARDKADAVSSSVREKADAVSSSVREKADEVGAQASAKINGVISDTGQQVSRMGKALHKRSSKNWADKATNATADALKSSGSYLQDQDVEGMRGGLIKMVCRHPFAALLISAGISFMLGRRAFR